MTQVHNELNTQSEITQVYNKTQKQLLVGNARFADTFKSRLIGLMGQTLAVNEGLIIRPCNSIHTFWMKIPIDVIFVNKDNVVLKVISNLNPWKMSPIVKNSAYVVEALPGTFDSVNVGDVVGVGKYV